jgi:hypothetical protein
VILGRLFMTKIEEARKLLKDNESFFFALFTDQNKFLQFYAASGKLDVIQEYSSGLMMLLRTHPEPTATTQAIPAWQNGDFEPALQNEVILDFLLNNKDHKAIQLWNDTLQHQWQNTADPVNVMSSLQQLENELIKAGYKQPTKHLPLTQAFQELRDGYISGRIDLQELTQSSLRIRSQIDIILTELSNRMATLKESGVEKAIATINLQRLERSKLGMNTPRGIFNILNNLQNLKLSFLNGEISSNALVGVRLGAEGEVQRIWKGAEQRLQLIQASGFDDAMKKLEEKRSDLVNRNFTTEGQELMRVIIYMHHQQDAYINFNLPFHQFKNNCEKAINKAMGGKLAEHREIKDVFELHLKAFSQFFSEQPYNSKTKTITKFQETKEMLKKMQEPIEPDSAESDSSLDPTNS